MFLGPGALSCRGIAIRLSLHCPLLRVTPSRLLLPLSCMWVVGWWLSCLLSWGSCRPGFSFLPSLCWWLAGCRCHGCHRATRVRLMLARSVPLAVLLLWIGAWWMGGVRRWSGLIVALDFLSAVPGLLLEEVGVVGGEP